MKARHHTKKRSGPETARSRPIKSTVDTETAAAPPRNQDSHAEPLVLPPWQAAVRNAVRDPEELAASIERVTGPGKDPVGWK